MNTTAIEFGMSPNYSSNSHGSRIPVFGESHDEDYCRGVPQVVHPQYLEVGGLSEHHYKEDFNSDRAQAIKSQFNLS